jgi:hypothetical protein
LRYGCNLQIPRESQGQRSRGRRNGHLAKRQRKQRSNSGYPAKDPLLCDRHVPERQMYSQRLIVRHGGRVVKKNSAEVQILVVGEEPKKKDMDKVTEYKKC